VSCTAVNDTNIPCASSPVPVDALGEMLLVAGGYSHSVALDVGSAVWTWGANSLGELGDGTWDDRVDPGPINR